MATVLDDRQMLFDFLGKTREVLHLFVEHRKILLPEFMQGLFSEAWGSINEAFDESINILGNDEHRELIIERLTFVGLTGIHLRLKMAVFNSYYEIVMGDPSFVETMVTEESTPKSTRKKKVKSWAMKKLLGVINSILGSLSKVIPIVDIIKEYKEMAEHGYEAADPDL